MIRFSEIRVWTVLSVVGICAYAALQATTVVGFAIADAKATRSNARIELEPFVDQRIVADRARSELARLTRGEEPVDRVATIGAVLAQRPLSSSAWLDLSQARLESSEEPAKVAAALALSSLTGPNESWMMARRANFALPLWRDLPPDSRRNLVADLVNGGFDAMDGAAREGLRRASSINNGKAIEELRSALLLNGKKGAEILKFMNLELEPNAAGAATRANEPQKGVGEDAVSSGASSRSPRTNSSLPRDAMAPVPLAPPMTLSPPR